MGSYNQRVEGADREEHEKKLINLRALTDSTGKDTTVFSPGGSEMPAARRAGFCKQLAILFQREAVNVKRNLGAE